jgi:hypothetical protein
MGARSSCSITIASGCRADAAANDSSPSRPSMVMVAPQAISSSSSFGGRVLARAMFNATDS